MKADSRQFSHAVRYLSFVLLVAGLGHASEARAQPVCANQDPWDVRYNNFAGNSTSTATCFNDGFKCEKAKSTGPVIELVNAGCDPKTGPCAINDHCYDGGRQGSPAAQDAEESLDV